MGNVGVKYRMSGHWHYIFTPKGLPDFKREHMNGFTRYSASAELGQGGRHWHIYIESDYDEKTIRDKLKLALHIPKGQKGKKSQHYSMRAVLHHNPDYPEENLQKFTLGYTVKNQSVPNFREDDHIHEGYDNDTLVEAYEYYWATTEKRYKAPEQKPQVNDEKHEELPQNTKIQDDWLEYQIYIEKTIKQRMMTRITHSDLRSLSRAWWAKRNNGLFPPAATYTRFLGSIIYYLRHQLTQTEDEALEKTNY